MDVSVCGLITLTFVWVPFSSVKQQYTRLCQIIKHIHIHLLPSEIMSCYIRFITIILLMRLFVFYMSSTFAMFEENVYIDNCITIQYTLN